MLVSNLQRMSEHPHCSFSQTCCRLSHPSNLGIFQQLVRAASTARDGLAMISNAPPDTEIICHGCKAWYLGIRLWQPGSGAAGGLAQYSWVASWPGHRASLCNARELAVNCSCLVRSWQSTLPSLTATTYRHFSLPSHAACLAAYKLPASLDSWELNGNDR
ncbi:hypothetical protein LZ30DRAFT_155031 [Colletotrichum cereale]|nr:hypothetical protein LZ30DRAFT_155031 [Colletotrichum cereale]